MCRYSHANARNSKVYVFHANGRCSQLRLNYEKAGYGPYANNLHHVLQAIDQHFISGYGDRTSSSNIRLKRGIDIANANFEKHEKTKKRVEKSSILSVVLKRPVAWNPRKKQLFIPRYIKIAKDKLLENPFHV